MGPPGLAVVYTEGGWVSLFGRRGAGSSRTAGWCRSCFMSELAIAGTVKPSAAPLHVTAATARQLIWVSSRAIVAALAGCFSGRTGHGRLVDDVGLARSAVRDEQDHGCGDREEREKYRGRNRDCEAG